MISSRTQAWLAAIALFVFGVAVGTAGTALLGLRSVKRAMSAPVQTQAQVVERATARVAQQLTRELELDEAAEARIRTELRRAALNIRRLRADHIRAMQTEIRSAAGRIAAELPPEQRERMENRIAQHLRRVGFESLSQPNPPARPPGS